MTTTQDRRACVPDQFPEAASAPARRLTALAVLAIVSQVVFLASALFLPAVSEFSLVEDHVSELALGRYGSLQSAAFLIVGIGTLGLAFAVRALTACVRGSLAGSILVAANGAGAILAAIFPTERIDGSADVWSQSTPGLIHVGVGIASFLSVVVGMLVLTWTFARAARWRSLALWSGLLASGALALMFVQAEGPWVGLTQRLLIGMTAAWMILVAARVRSIATAELAAVEKVSVPRAA